MGSASEQRRGCRVESSLWCPLGPEDHALSSSTHGAARRAERAVTRLQQLGWGRLTLKGAGQPAGVGWG